MTEPMDKWEEFCLRADEARILYGSAAENEFSDPDPRVFGAIESSRLGSLRLDESEKVRRLFKGMLASTISELQIAIRRNDSDLQDQLREKCNDILLHWQFSPSMGSAIIASELELQSFEPL